MDIDSVYFFCWPDFSSELRSNRWYFAKLWSKYQPVVILQPDLSLFATPYIESVDTLPNVQIVHIYGADMPRLAPDWDVAAYGVGQVKQIRKIQSQLGHARPLFWGYNPNLAYSFLTLEAVCRVYHATENYFDFEGLDVGFHVVLAGMIGNCDLVVSCSDGVARGITENIENASQIVYPNGCDYEFFSTPRQPSRDVKNLIYELEQQGQFAVFAGNINSRLDFELVGELANAGLDLNILFIGPVEPSLPDDGLLAWKQLMQRDNVHYLPEIVVEDLPFVYSHARLGIIPYRLLKYIVDNGFPLKALEMGAAGLPVIATLMRPLEAVPEIVTIAKSQDEFVAACRDEISVTPGESRRTKMRNICRKHDYSARFGEVLGAIATLRNAPLKPQANIFPLETIFRRDVRRVQIWFGILKSGIKIKIKSLFHLSR